MVSGMCNSLLLLAAALWFEVASAAEVFGSATSCLVETEFAKDLETNFVQKQLTVSSKLEEERERERERERGEVSLLKTNVDSAFPAEMQLLQKSLPLQPVQLSALPSKIAFEEHVWFSELDHLALDSWDAVSLEDFGENRLHSMDRNGIRIAVLSTWSHYLSDLNDSKFQGKFHNLTGMNASQILDLQVQLAKRINDLMYKHINRSSRYRGFAALPMSSPIAAAEELTRCVNSLGFVGAMINGVDTNMKEFTGNINYYDTDEYDVLWQKFEELDVPLYIHPRAVTELELNQFYKTYSVFQGAKLGYAESTAHLALALMESGVFERFKGMQIILGHMGEILPFVASRMDSIPGGVVNVQHTLSANFYATTSGFFDTFALQHVIGVMGVERVLFATDYPSGYPGEAGSWFEQAVKKIGLNETEKDMIEFKNAEQLLRIVKN